VLAAAIYNRVIKFSNRIDPMGLAPLMSADLSDNLSGIGHRLDSSTVAEMNWFEFHHAPVIVVVPIYGLDVKDALRWTVC